MNLTLNKGLIMCVLHLPWQKHSAKHVTKLCLNVWISVFASLRWLNCVVLPCFAFQYAPGLYFTLFQFLLFLDEHHSNNNWIFLKNSTFWHFYCYVFDNTLVLLFFYNTSLIWEVNRTQYLCSWAVTILTHYKTVLLWCTSYTIYTRIWDNSTYIMVPHHNFLFLGKLLDRTCLTFCTITRQLPVFKW
jgi:hypothetical protein